MPLLWVCRCQNIVPSCYVGNPDFCLLLRLRSGVQKLSFYLYDEVSKALREVN